MTQEQRNPDTPRVSVFSDYPRGGVVVTVMPIEIQGNVAAVAFTLSRDEAEQLARLLTNHAMPDLARSERAP